MLAIWLVSYYAYWGEDFCSDPLHTDLYHTELVLATTMGEAVQLVWEKANPVSYTSTVYPGSPVKIDMNDWRREANVSVKWVPMKTGIVDLGGR